MYHLFDGQVGFGDLLLEMASESGGFYDEEKLPDHQSPPTASRRFRYMSSLAQSFNAGRISKMGIICEGETGLLELDRDGYHGYGYYGTVILIWILGTFVLIGTVSASWLLNSSIENNELKDDESKDYSPREGDKEYFNQHQSSSMINSGNDSKTNYGSNNGISNQSNDDIESEREKSVSFLAWAHGIEIQNDNKFDKRHEDESESDHLLQSTKEIQYINSEEKRGIELRRSASFSLAERMNEGKGWVHSYSAFMSKLKSIFSYFDAGQSFYEITRMTREDPYVDSLHQQRLRKAGETSLDPSSSTTGLFPMYKALSPLSKGKIHPDQTVSVSSSKCLNGMRSISMLWIILGHTLAVQSSVGYVNPAAILPPSGMMTSILGKIILSARYAVDTFFFIGGFLVMSGLLKMLDPLLADNLSISMKERKLVSDWKIALTSWGIMNPKHVVIGEYANRFKSKKSSKKEAVRGIRWVIPFLLHRILRILPTYFFVLLLWWKVAVHLGDGPFWPRWATFVAQCDAHAWTNMLFINNLVPWVQPFGETSECMYHAWYLGVDFQLCLVFAPIFVTLYLRKGWRMRTILLEVLTIVGIIVATLYFSFKYNWSAHLWDGIDTVAFDRGFYINPLFRSTPYLIGFITGQIWHEKCRLFPNAGLSRSVSIFISIISVSIMVYWTAFASGTNTTRPCLIWESPRYSNCGSGWSSTELALFNSFGRPAWGLGLSLMSLLCFNGQLSCFWSSTILTWPGWDPISKLSFSMYLLHPLVINVWVLGGDDKFRFSIIDLLFAFSGIVLITFVVAISIGILVEWPMSRITRDLEKKLWSKKKTGNEEPYRGNGQDGGQIVGNLNEVKLTVDVDMDYRYRINLSPSTS